MRAGYKVNHQYIYEKLTGIFHDLFDDDSIVLSATTSSVDVQGWDSLAQVRLLVAAEQAFGIRFMTSEVEGLPNVGELVTIIDQKLA